MCKRMLKLASDGGEIWKGDLNMTQGQYYCWKGEKALMLCDINSQSMKAFHLHGKLEQGLEPKMLDFYWWDGTELAVH